MHASRCGFKIAPCIIIFKSFPQSLHVSTLRSLQVKLVSLNPLAKHAKVKAKTEEEQLETRQLENALDKICRCG